MTQATLLERTIAGLDGLARARGRAAELPAHLTTGLAGEDAAFFELRRKGYRVVARRWAAGDAPGDVDLIAWQGGVLCFIEVKTRTALDLTPAEAAVDEHKRATLRRLARRYLRQLPQPPDAVRFDVMSVYLISGGPREVTHFEGAFTLGVGGG
ncbi:MAG TPA: YraN family protein [Terracidiphilus sp.]|nr:YraN family protein [Terracidiphilus sp.]